MQIDPFDEQAHASLIRLLAQNGNRQEALQQYEHCRNVFERELGSRPGAIVEDARRLIGEWRTGASPVRDDDRRGRLSSTSFIGRERELAQIEAATTPVVIIGEPGIGKSRLLDEVRRRANGATLYGRAYAARRRRGRTACGSTRCTISRRRATGRGSSTPSSRNSQGSNCWPSTTCNGSTRLRPRCCTTSRAKTQQRIVCAARVGEIDDNPHASRLVRDLARDKRLSTRSAVDVRRRSALVDAAPDRDRVVAESGGNPLFALELARAESAGTLTQVIASRLAQLDGRARDVVSWAAAIGRRFDAEILGRATEMPSGEMLSALAKLERSSIIRASERGGSYDFTHDLIRDGAYQAISGPRRLLVHRHIARALQSVHDPEATLAGEIMRHASIAGDHSLAVLSAIAAGRRCLRLFAYAEAQNVVRLGAQLAEALPERERVEREIALMEIAVMCRVPIADRMGFAPHIQELIERSSAFGLNQSAAWARI